ncbi:hypothetical protein KBC03_01160 [Patescibacteria group bacterium]|nr:hypothetical protein [Patescibacteria group bacterium]
MKKIFQKLASANHIFNSYLRIARNATYGKLVSCPTNIGTGMRLSVMLTLPKLAQDMDALKKKAKAL